MAQRPGTAVEPAVNTTPLNEQQITFCREYSVDFNITQAAKRTGYSARSAHTIGYKLLKDGRIQAELARIAEERRDKTEQRAARVVKELESIALTNMGQLAQWGHSVQVEVDDETGERSVTVASGVAFKDSSELPPEVMAAVSEISQTKDGIKLKLHSKPQALELLGKHYGIIKTHHEHSGPNGGPIRHAVLSMTVDPIEASKAYLDFVNGPTGD